MARKGNPISVRLDLNRSSDSSWFSDYYYGKLVYQDVNLRSYFGSIRPPTRLTFGFRLGRCIILHIFPKAHSFISFFPVDHITGSCRGVQARDWSYALSYSSSVSVCQLRSFCFRKQASMHLSLHSQSFCLIRCSTQS